VKHKLNIALFIVIMASEILLFRSSDALPLILIITALVFLAIVGLGVLFIQFNYFLISKSRLTGKKVLLTFDDGPVEGSTERILEVLQENGIGAVFFLIGKKVEANKFVAEKIVREGHIIGNHTYSHNNFTALYSTKKLIKEIGKTEDILNAISTDRPKLFRPPIGYTTPNYARALKHLKLKCIGWRLRSYDTLSKNSETFVKRLVRSTKEGDIVLFHDNLKVTAESLADYIISAKRNGIIFVSKEDLKNLFV